MNGIKSCNWLITVDYYRYHPPSARAVGAGFDLQGHDHCYCQWQVSIGRGALADRVGPSHAFVHIVDFSRPVTVAGMRVSDGDVIHADQHGAVVIPHAMCDQVKAAAALIARRERVIISAAQQPGFDADALRKAQQESAQVQ